MWFGVESGSETYRKTYLNRSMSNQLIVEAAENARKFGIRRLVFNMIGMPFETQSDMWKTLELTKRIQPELTVYGQYLPLPRTPLYETAKEHGLLLSPSESRQMCEIRGISPQCSNSPGIRRSIRRNPCASCRFWHQNRVLKPGVHLPTPTI